MVFSEIVTDAKTLTEGKANSLPVDRMVRRCLQKVCRTRRFDWRKQSVTFSTTASSATYDLSSVTTSPVLKGKDLEEVIAVYYVKSATEVIELDVATGEGNYAVAAADTSDTGEPTCYLIEPGASQTLRLSPIPNGTYTIRVVFWAIPYFSSDDSTDAIPYLPVNSHHVLLSCLCSEMAAFAYGGSDDAKAAHFKQQYDADLYELWGKSKIDVNDILRVWGEDDAIRAT